MISTPDAFAIWMANVPTPPPPPFISTRWPGCSGPPFSSPATANPPAWGTAAACSKVRKPGIGVNADSGARAYCANAPNPHPDRSPNTASPGRNRVTDPPTASTTPAMSDPRVRRLGRRSPLVRFTIGVPRIRP